jgi:hypothetical protein
MVPLFSVQNFVDKLAEGECHDQGESMGLLEYQAMPSLHDVDHDNVLCTFSYR